MIIAATPEPDGYRPRVRLDLTADPGENIADVTITRDGSPLRKQPYPGSNVAVAFDYEAPFGRPLTYRATGSVIPPVTPDWTETWSSLASWAGATGSFSVSGGKASSLVSGAAITRNATGAIQRVDVADPWFVRLELLSSSDTVVASVLVDTKVTLIGVSLATTSGGGDFALTVSNGAATVAAVDGSWSVSRPTVGTPTKVRVVSLGVSYPPDSTLSTVGYSDDVAADSAGNIYVADVVNTRIRKFNPAGVQTLSIPLTTSPKGVAVDSAGNIYVGDPASTRIRKFNPAGVQTLSIPMNGSHGIWGFNLDAVGNIYVVSYAAFHKYNPAGVLALNFALPGIPADVAVNSSGIIHVLDSAASLVRRYSVTGVAQTNIATVGEGAGLDVDTLGNVYVTDKTNKVIRKFAPAGAGTQTAAISVPGDPYALTVGSTGKVYVLERTATALKIYTPQTSTIGTIVETPEIPLTQFVVEASTVLEVTEAWLIHPTYPALSCSIDPGQHKFRDDGINVDATTKTNVGRAARSTTHEPPASRRKVVFTAGPRPAGEWDLVLRTRTLTGRNQVDAICDDQSPLLIRAPHNWSWDIPDGWYTVGDYSEERTRPRLDSEDRLMTLPLTPVDEPTVQLAAPWTYGADLLLHATYAEALAAMPTYLDRLAGP